MNASLASEHYVAAIMPEEYPLNPRGTYDHEGGLGMIALNGRKLTISGWTLYEAPFPEEILEANQVIAEDEETIRTGVWAVPDNGDYAFWAVNFEHALDGIVQKMHDEFDARLYEREVRSNDD